jgi:antitoxin (DNA-binding transcriptional repressor) of toxin-antitoxin stability system
MNDKQEPRSPVLTGTSVGQLISAAQDRYGWADSTLLQVLTGYIASQNSSDALAGYLAERGRGAPVLMERPADPRRIETGSAHSVPVVGRAACVAARVAADGDVITHLTIDGRPAAAIVPVDSQGNPACMRIDHMDALAQAGRLPEFLKENNSAGYRFSIPVSIICEIDGDQVAASAVDLGVAWTAAREHEYRHQPHI